MSHFTVAVFSKEPDDVDKLLEPFYEALPACSPFMEFVENERADVDDVAQRRGYWRNPQGYWDEWTIGGPLCGILRLKPGCTAQHSKHTWVHDDFTYPDGRCAQALVADCDFTPDPKVYAEALRRWEVLVEGAPLRKDEPAIFSFLRPQYYINQYGSKEGYASHEARMNTYAFITADGRWIAPGCMGSFGIDDSTRDSQQEYNAMFDAYIKQAAEEGLFITVVDCHI